MEEHATLMKRSRRFDQSDKRRGFSLIFSELNLSTDT